MSELNNGSIVMIIWGIVTYVGFFPAWMIMMVKFANWLGDV